MGYKDLDVKEFAQYIKQKDIQLLDVRTREEYDAEHLAGAVNVDWMGADFMPKVERIIDKSRPVAIYCRSGRRSDEAGHAMASQGYDVANLLGGILAWMEAGEPVMK